MATQACKTYDDILSTAHLDTEPGVLPHSHLYRLLAECFSIIERRYLNAPDLYRTAGSKEEVDALYRYYWNYRRLDVDGELNFMSITSLAKIAVRKMTEQREDSLFPDALLEKLGICFKNLGPKFTPAKKVEVYTILEKHASRQQLSLIITIVTHLSVLIKRAPSCTCKSLELCWMPTLLGPYRFARHGSIVQGLIQAFL